MNKRLTVIALAAALLSALAGCRASQADAVARDSDSLSASFAASAKSADCTVDQLKITTGQSHARMAHRSIAVVFRNISAKTCRLHGYPGTAALNRNGTQLAPAKQTLNGYFGGVPAGSTPPTVNLASGQAASALVEAVAPDCSVNQDPTCADQLYTGLRVTPPDNTRSVTLSWPGGDAGQLLEVHPVVPGETGQM